MQNSIAENPFTLEPVISSSTHAILYFHGQYWKSAFPLCFVNMYLLICLLFVV